MRQNFKMWLNFGVRSRIFGSWPDYWIQ